MKYTAVIRTLGQAGEKYQRTLDSLISQNMPPEEIIIYIAEDYPLPKETCGKERFVTVKKGMIAQRALPYNEVKTEWILFLDDDVYLPVDGVQQLFKAVDVYGAEVVSPDVFDNSARSVKSEILMTISGRMRARRGDKKWGYKVMRTAGYSYNQTPSQSLEKSGRCPSRNHWKHSLWHSRNRSLIIIRLAYTRSCRYRNRTQFRLRALFSWRLTVLCPLSSTFADKYLTTHRSMEHHPLLLINALTAIQTDAVSSIQWPKADSLGRCCQPSLI